jgi:hypothetical protein
MIATNKPFWNNKLLRGIVKSFIVHIFSICLQISHSDESDWQRLKPLARYIKVSLEIVNSTEFIHLLTNVRLGGNQLTATKNSRLLHQW